MDILGRLSEWQLFLVSAAVFLAVIELAYRLGRRHHPSSDDSVRSHVQSLQNALLGLLSLLLGFNFAMAVARFDARTVLIQEEVGAINTARLRAQLLAPRDQQEAMALLKSYVGARVDFMRAVEEGARVEAASAAAARLHAQLWTLVERVVGQGAGAPAVPFLQAVNDVITVNGKRSTVPSRRLQPGDVVALAPRSRDLATFLGPLENARPSAHLSLDKEKRSVRVNEVPEREQIPVICEISLVVEYYSR